jgi:hypothetical protein
MSAGSAHWARSSSRTAASAFAVPRSSRNAHILAATWRTGIDLDAITDQLEREGIAAFCDSYRGLLGCIHMKRDAHNHSVARPA